MPSINKPVRGQTVPSHALRAMGVALLFLSTTSFAAAQQSSDNRDRRGPPPEAFTACEFQNVDDVCSVALSDRTLEGTCVVPRGPKRRGSRERTETETSNQTTEQSLICKPEGHRPPTRGGESRPPETKSE